MNKLKLSLWIFALANLAVALAGMCLNCISEIIFYSFVVAGRDPIPKITHLYLGYRVLTFAVIAIPLPIAALVLTVRRSINSETTLLFGAVTVLLIALQTFLAVVAVGAPFFNSNSRFLG